MDFTFTFETVIFETATILACAFLLVPQAMPSLSESVLHFDCLILQISGLSCDNGLVNSVHLALMLEQAHQTKLLIGDSPFALLDHGVLEPVHLLKLGHD